MFTPHPTRRAAALTALMMLMATVARAQLYENVGTRAQGMAGAFVAVADDANAGWWNPAGLATGAVFNIVVERARQTEPKDPVGIFSSTTTGTSGFAFALPSLGVNNYRFRISESVPAPSTAAGDAPRPDGEVPVAQVRSVAVGQLGVTLGQSLGDHLVLGTTVKLVKGGAVTTLVDATEDTLDLANDLDIDSETKFDLDLGAMLSFTHLRLGISLRNTTAPSFGEAGNTVTLERQSRAGVAILSGPVSILQSVVVSADFDLTRTSTLFGDVRHAAVGTELTMLNRRLVVRAGASRSTAGPSRQAASTGFSVAVVRGVFIEGATTFGADEALAGWSSSVRVTF
jgi:opacity protein-like surface antigen